MQTYGSLEDLKEAIEKKYGEEIRKKEKETETEVNKLNNELEEKEKIEKLRAETSLEAEEKKAYGKILSEEKLKAKRSFEKTREEMINQIFKETEKKSAEIVKTKRYIDFVKKKAKNIPKSAVITANSDIYKKDFKAKINIDKNILGMKFKQGDIVYDLTLDGLIRSRKDEVRHIISKTLFA